MSSRKRTVDQTSALGDASSLNLTATPNNRKSYSDAQNVALVTQVDRVCPLCSRPLFRRKRGQSYKDYQIAHIYPLNPKPDEIELLKGEDRLSEDVNAEENVIPLCIPCHDGFDKPRTVEEYRNLVAIKRALIERDAQQELWGTYSIEKEITLVIEKLYSDTPDYLETEIQYDPKSIDDKFDNSITIPTKVKIKAYVVTYYSWIRHQLALLDKSYPETSQIISSQIRAFYLKQKQQGRDQQSIFEMIVDWIYVKTKPRTRDASEIIASFFVQNCEIFE